MNRISAAVIGASAWALPIFVFAQSNPDLGNLSRLLTAIGKLVNLATPIVVGLALLAFFWGLVKFIFSASEDDKGAGKRLMIGGIIAIFVMVSIVGIIRFIGNAFDVDQGGSLPVPGVDETTDNR